MREYERTHPWITFTLDLRPLPWETWLLLGEVQSKCEHIAQVPLRPDVAAKLHLLYLAKGVRATTAIEGNTLTEEQVKNRLEGKLDLPKSKEYLGVEVDNIARACDSLFERAVKSPRLSITPDLIKEMNSMVLKGLDLPNEVEAGKIRTYSVGVARYRGAPHQDCEYLLERLCEWLNSRDFAPMQEHTIAFAALTAVFAHLYLAWIHPFGDGNGRTARLLEFYILVGASVPTPAAHLLSNYYNETRTAYYRQLDDASQGKGAPIGFVNYAVRGLVDELRSQLQPIWEQQWELVWTNYVHDKFHNKNSPADVRRRRLVLDLSRAGKPVALNDLRSLTVRMAQAYTGRTRKTLVRDVNILVQMGLIEKHKGAYKATTDVIQAFLPGRRAKAEPKDSPAGQHPVVRQNPIRSGV